MMVKFTNKHKLHNIRCLRDFHAKDKVKINAIQLRLASSCTQAKKNDTAVT